MGELVKIATEQMLRDWALWSSQGRPNPKGAQSWLGVMMDRLVQQSRGASPIYAESRIEAFDQRVMLPIKLNSRKTYEALEYYYSNPAATAESLGKRLRIRKQTACDLLNLGRQLVEELADQEGMRL